MEQRLLRVHQSDPACRLLLLLRAPRPLSSHGMARALILCLGFSSRLHAVSFLRAPEPISNLISFQKGIIFQKTSSVLSPSSFKTLCRPPRLPFTCRNLPPLTQPHSSLAPRSEGPHLAPRAPERAPVSPSRPYRWVLQAAPAPLCRPSCLPTYPQANPSSGPSSNPTSSSTVPDRFSSRAWLTLATNHDMPVPMCRAPCHLFPFPGAGSEAQGKQLAQVRPVCKCRTWEPFPPGQPQASRDPSSESQGPATHSAHPAFVRGARRLRDCPQGLGESPILPLRAGGS